jgi:regulatory protein
MAKKEVRPLDFALKILEISDRSESELRKKMEIKGYKPAEIDSALIIIKEKKYINDEAYAKKIVEKYTSVSPSGREFIKQKMEEKGIKPELFEGLLDARSEPEAAKAAFRAKFGGRAAQENPLKTRQQASNYLLTKGFDYDIIENTLNSEIKGGNCFE